jgi:hypothetical protein
MRRRAKVDANHASVVQALRSVGWTVFDTSRLGNGFVDAVAARRGRVEFIEIKDGHKVPSARKLTAKESSFHQACQLAGVTVRIIESVSEALEL